VLVAGGNSNRDGRVVEISSVERYDPAGNQWSPGKPLAQPRSDHTATLLPDGSVLVVGGFSVSAEVGSAERYDPETDSWSSAGSLVTPRAGHTAVLLPNGLVLIAGGLATNANGRVVDVKTAELYDPATNGWKPAGNLETARSGHSATLLSNGLVLVAGGESNAGTPLASTELYDPAGNFWLPAAPMGTARHGHTSTLLADGGVLVVGGNVEQQYQLARSGAAPVAARRPAARGCYCEIGPVPEPVLNSRVKRERPKSPETPLIR
jgi:N-acetylneuraminic acid mutarotase